MSLFYTTLQRLVFCPQVKLLTSNFNFFDIFAFLVSLLWVWKNWLIFSVDKILAYPQYGQNRLPNRWTLPQMFTEPLLLDALENTIYLEAYFFLFHFSFFHFLSFKTFSNCWSLTLGNCQDSKLDILHPIPPPPYSWQNSKAWLLFPFISVVFNSYM